MARRISDRIRDFFSIRSPRERGTGRSGLLGRQLSCEPLEERRLLAVTWHVDAGNVGDPLEDGSVAHPYDQIQEAVDAAALTGDTVSLAAGTYAEHVTLNKQLVLTGNSQSDTTLQGHVEVSNPGGGTTTIENLAIDTSGMETYGLNLATASSVTVRDVVFVYDDGDNAIRANGGSTLVDISIGTPGHGNTFVDNSVGSRANAISIDGDAQGAEFTNFTIEHNEFQLADTGWGVIVEAANAVGTSSGLKIADNDFTDQGGVGVLLVDNSSGVNGISDVEISHNDFGDFPGWNTYLFSANDLANRLPTAIDISSSGNNTFSSDAIGGASWIGDLGSANALYPTIQDAIDQAVPGEEIVVGPGTYTEDLIIDKADLTLRSSEGKSATTLQLVDGVGIDIRGNGDGFTLGGASDQGFAIDDGGATTFLVQLANGPSSVEISHNSLDLTGNGSQGISVGAAGAANLTIDHNEIVAGDGDGAMFGDNPIVDLSVTNNTLTVSGVSQQATGYGIEFFGLTGTSLIDSNQITGYSNGILVANGTGTDGLTISNNVVQGSGNGIRFADYVQTGIAGNIGAVTLDGNTLEGNETGLLFGSGSHLSAGTYTVVQNTFAANTNYHFRSTGDVFDGQEVFSLFADGNNSFDTASVVSDAHDVVQSTASLCIRPSIQQSIGDASGGDHVVALAGTGNDYTESLTINKSLTLRGSSSVPADVVVNPGASNDGIAVTGGDSVTIQNLRITGADRGVVANNLSLFELKNLLLDGNSSGGTVTNVGDLVIAGGDGNDTVTVDGTTPGHVDINVNANQTITVVGATSLILNGSGGDDTFRVLDGEGLQGVAISVDGGVQGTRGDVLQVVGTGDSGNAKYTPDVAVEGNGQVAVEGGPTITFSGLEPVDVTGFAVATILLPGADDVLTVENSFDASTGLIPALRVDGTSGGVAIEDARFFANTTMVIDTSTVDGTDSVTINSADNLHSNTNFEVLTGVNSDSILIAGATDVSGDLTLRSGGGVTQIATITAGGAIVVEASSGNVDMQAGSSTESTGGGNIRLVAEMGDLILRMVQTGGSVSLLATNDILDGNVDSSVNVSADTLVMVADSDGDTEGMIGQADTLNGTPAVNDNAIDTQVTTLAARSAEGIHVQEADGVTVGTIASPVSLSGLTTTGNGPIKVVTLAGDLDVAAAVWSGGDVLLDARTGNANVDAEAISFTGQISIVAGANVNQSANISADGSILVQTSSGGITMQPGTSTTSTGGGNIRLVAGEGDLVLGLVHETTGSVGLVAESDILDGNGGGTVNVSADMLVMVADSDSDTEGMIGQDDMLNGMPDVNDNAIDTQVTTLAARAAEGIYILEVDGLTIGTSAALGT